MEDLRMGMAIPNALTTCSVTRLLGFLLLFMVFSSAVIIFTKKKKTMISCGHVSVLIRFVSAQLLEALWVGVCVQTPSSASVS